MVNCTIAGRLMTDRYLTAYDRYGIVCANDWAYVLELGRKAKEKGCPKAGQRILPEALALTPRTIIRVHPEFRLCFVPGRRSYCRCSLQTREWAQTKCFIEKKYAV